MMSKKKWMVLLLVFIVYLFLGASFFYKIESLEERRKLAQEEADKNEIQKILEKHFTNREQLDILVKLSEYCGKSMSNETDDLYYSPPKWDFYHSLFFSITVVSTIGYGNLAPTTSFSRIFMICYGLIGIPMNGILFANLGEFFGQIFIKLYRKWKNSKVKNYAASLGLVSQIVLYLVPGFAIFIFLPAIVIMHFEKWDPVLAVYYAFVTLTTIGFGDYVAGVENQGFADWHFRIYQIFLVIWIIFGLGYLVMIIGFITRGMRSKKMARLEKHLTSNIKSTQSRIWHGFVKDLSYLRRVMNELYMSKFKPVYRDDCSGASSPRLGSQSLPDLRKLCPEETEPLSAPELKRRRAQSECGKPLTDAPLTRVQSDTDLNRVDRQATFAHLGVLQPCEMLYQVASVLTASPTDADDDDALSDAERGYHGLSDSQILASELYGSGWTIGSGKLPAQPPPVPRNRACSEVKLPGRHFDAPPPTSEWTWSGPAATQQINALRSLTGRFDKGKPARRPGEGPTNRSILGRLKHSLTRTRDEARDVERQLASVHSGRSLFTGEQEGYLARTGRGRPSAFSIPESQVLEETSVADLIRALTSVHARVAGQPDLMPEPRRKLGTACLTPPKVPSLLELFSPLPGGGRKPPGRLASGARRASMAPAAPLPRRFSLHPLSEDQLLMPPPAYTPSAAASAPAPRAFPPGAGNPMHKQVSRLRGSANERILYTRTRHNSLKDIRIEKP